MTIDQLTDPAPHTCPECGEPSYLGFNVPARCTNRMCVFFDQDIWVEHVMALPDEEVGVEFEIEDDEATNPYTKVQGLSAWLPPPTKGAKVSGGGQLSFPEWYDLVQEYLDGDDSSTFKLRQHATTDQQIAQIASARRTWYRKNAARIAARTGKLWP